VANNIPEVTVASNGGDCGRHSEVTVANNIPEVTVANNNRVTVAVF
jgi:hypothetical protein